MKQNMNFIIIVSCAPDHVTTNFLEFSTNFDKFYGNSKKKRVKFYFYSRKKVYCRRNIDNENTIQMMYITEI